MRFGFPRWKLRLRSRVSNWMLAWLQKSLKHYDPWAKIDPGRLRAALQKGDVLLVEGDQRLSVPIKYFTQSCWSHSALYIGDELWLQSPGQAAAACAGQKGEGALGDAKHLLVEALPHGVTASPISKYENLHVRIMRPIRLDAGDLKKIMDGAINAIGLEYDLKNVFDLMRYFIPSRLVSQRGRKTALHFGSGEPTQVICSSLISRLFQTVKYPILPEITEQPGPSQTRRGAGRKVLERIFGYEHPEHYTGLFKMRSPTLITPRDFDLSPYFEVVKFNRPGGEDFNYRLIRWESESQARAGAPETSGAPGATDTPDTPNTTGAAQDSPGQATPDTLNTLRAPQKSPEPATPSTPSSNTPHNSPAAEPSLPPKPR